MVYLKTTRSQVKACKNDTKFKFVLENVTIGTDRDRIIEEVKQKWLVYGAIRSKRTLTPNDILINSYPSHKPFEWLQWANAKQT